MVALDCPHCGAIGTVTVTRTAQDHQQFRKYECTRCHNTWKLREDERSEIDDRRRVPRGDRRKK